MWFLNVIAAFLLVFGACVHAEINSENNISSDVFGSLPDVSNVRLSPDGTKIVARVLIDTPDLRGTALQVTHLESGEQKLVLFTDNEKFDLTWTRWKTNNVILAGVMYPDTRTAFGPKQETRESDLIVINLKNGETHNIFKATFFAKFKEKPAGRDDVIDILPEDKDHVLLQMRGRLSDMGHWTPRVYKVNIHTQRAKVIQEPVEDIFSWQTDRQHRIRLARKFFDNDIIILIRDVGSKKWRELWRYRNYSEENVTPLGFGVDPNILYVRAYKNSFQAIFKVDLRDVNLTKSLVYSNDNYDVDGSLIYSRVTNDVIGISSSYDDKTIYFNEEQQALQASIDKALPKTKNFVYSLSDDERKYLVYSYSDIESGTYLYGNRDKKSLDVVAYRYKNLPPEKMRTKKKWTFAARDGITIEGFLTMPLGASDSALPTVVFPHGGPLAYDDQGFDSWVQMLANRGYAVFQPNFRGSIGRGLAFRNAGIEDQSAAMKDIEDGTRALIKAGLADENRVCIAGISFGGYAALYGVSKTPDLYTCGISVAGLSDITDKLVLNDEERLVRGGMGARKLSPINFADKVKVPVLLIHGDNDRQVDVSQSQRMYSALQKEGKDVKYVELPNEDHYLTDNANRKLTFKEIDQFLGEFLPVD